VSLLHHEKKHKAPAPRQTSLQNAFSPTDVSSDADSRSALGVIPHQIRGSLVTYTMMNCSVPSFQYCTGCSLPLIEAYKENKFDLVSKACDSLDGSFLENLSGLMDFRMEADEKLAQMEDDWDDDE
jgi:ubiquitin-like modifier-activating enzyme ATG7